MKFIKKKELLFLICVYLLLMLPFGFLAFLNRDEGALSLAVGAGIILLVAVIYLAVHPAEYKIISQKIASIDISKSSDFIFPDKPFSWKNTHPVKAIFYICCFLLLLIILFALSIILK